VKLVIREGEAILDQMLYLITSEVMILGCHFNHICLVTREGSLFDLIFQSVELTIANWSCVMVMVMMMMVIMLSL
jgi:hypothetical protein